MTEVVAVAKLRAFIERVERIEADIAEMNAGKSDVYKEIRGEGFDVKTVRKIVSKRKLDTNERQEQDALFDLYWDALHGEGRAPAHARENIEEFGAELPAHDADGVIIEQPETANETKRQVVAGGSSRETAANVDQGATAGETAHSGIAQGRGEGRTLTVQVSSPAPATNSPSTPSYPEVVEQAGAVSSSAAAPVPNSHSSEPNSSQAETKTAGEVTPPTSPAPYSDADVPAFIRAPVNERCLKQGACQFARHPHKITCSDCGSAFIKKRAEARP